jgi:zinc/manganese transport system substrate-binding protein
MFLRRALLFAPLATPALSQPRPVMVASFSILGDLVRCVAGDAAEVRTIAGPEVDAHHFQPRPSHAEALRGATHAFQNGWGFDDWFARLARGAGGNARLVTVTEGLAARPVRSGGHSHGANDPHAWQDVSAARHYIRRIAQATGLDATAQDARLAELDTWVKAEIARVPEARRVVVTSHDAFGWFSAAYGVRFLAPQGVSTSAEPSAQQVAGLIRQLRAGGIKALFMENLTNPATLNRVAAEAGVQVTGRLYADALSPPDGPAPDYEAMMRHNVSLLVRGMLA